MIKQKNTILLRLDIDVPIRNNRIIDDSRLKAMLPTINKYKKNKLIIMGHIGRPKDGKGIKTDIVAKRFAKLLKRPIYKLNNCIGPKVEKFVSQMQNGDIAILENLRFHEEEKKNTKSFAKKLAKLADVYVNDSFSTSHRKHASIDAIQKYLALNLGENIKKEVKQLSRLKSPKRPYVAILGAAKISDKILLIDNLCKKVDKLLLGGAVVFTFYKSMGLEVGKSLVDDSKLKECKKLLKKYSDKIILPTDVVLDNKKIVDVNKIPKNRMGLDIGPKSVKMFKDVLKRSKTVFWNGPLGKFETKPFDKSTKQIARFISNSKLVSILGGGDTGSAVKGFKFTHLSTAGGASIEFIEGKQLPGLPKNIR